MRLLLDTNVFLWWREASPRLSPRAANEIRDPANDAVVSIGALWEIAIKRGLGKLQFREDFEEVMRDEGFMLLPISYVHLRALENLPRIHKDPFDRLFIAQALTEGVPIATADRSFAAYGVQVVW